jgi:hypothetical protein
MVMGFGGIPGLSLTLIERIPPENSRFGLPAHPDGADSHLN